MFNYMFCIELICFYLILYTNLFFTGFGVSSLLCRGQNEQYRYWLAPLIGALILSILPIYFSILGINTSIAGRVIFLLFGCYSVLLLIKAPPVAGTIKADSVILALTILPALIPSLTVILKAGCLTSTLESYSAFITIPADHLLQNTFDHSIAVDYNKPVTNLLAEVVGNHEYFGPFFLTAALAAISGTPPYKLYLVSSAVLASFLPLSAFIAAREGFGLQRKWALLLSLLVSTNYSFFMWPMIGQMPMTGGMAYLVLTIGFIPSFFESEAKVDYFFYSALIAGVLSMYWILIPYVVGVYLLYSFFRFRSHSIKSTPLRIGLKLAIGSLIINPFTLIFLCLHGAEMVTTTSQFSKNIPRYPYLEEILGLGQHFSMTHDGTMLSYAILGITVFLFLLISIGCYARFYDKDHFFVSVLSVFLLLACLFYSMDFSYHFYKNAVIGAFVLLVALAAGLSWSLARFQFVVVKYSLIALICLFVSLNMVTMVSYSLTGRRVIGDSLTSLAKLTEVVPPNSLILVNSFDPTQEAWISYFLKDRKLKLRGSVEAWGFWILAPFSGNPNPAFFFDPHSDSIDYTLSHRPRNSADIIRPERHQLVAANQDFLLTGGLSDPFLFKGWHPAEESDSGVYRWTERESTVLIGKSGEDYVLKITGEIPLYYDKPVGVQFSLNGESVGRLESGPVRFTRKYLLTKENMSKMYNLLSIDLDSTFYPDRIMNNADTRNLGIAISSIELQPEEMFRFSDLIDVGNIAFDKYLMNGWSFNEVLQNSTTFRWVEGKDASLTVFLQSVENMKMEFRALPFRYSSSPPQEATIYINGDIAERVLLTHDNWQVYNVDIPSELLREGLNGIDFVFRSAASPSKVFESSDDPRSLSAAFDYIRLYRPSQGGSQLDRRLSEN